MIEYNPYDKAVKQDPERYFQALRAECPVHHHVVDNVEVGKMNDNPWIAEPTTEFWSVFRYDDVVKVLQSPEVFSSREGPGPERARALTEDGMLIFADEPAHRWQRSIANKAFTPRRVAQLEPDIQATADAIIDGFADEGECDLFADFAVPLTIRVVAKIVGVDESRIDDFFRWGNDTINAFGADEEGIKRSFASAMEFHAYITELVTARHQAIDSGGEVPDDIFTAMVTADADGKKLNDVELFMGAQQFMVAGFETTASTIVNGFYLLDQHPKQKDKVLSDPSKFPQLVEEILRYSAPLEGLCRTAMSDTEIDGVQIPKNAKVRWMMASANRDDRQFDRPDEFDIDRDPKQLRRHLAFGHGIHTCLGAALARMEVKVGLETLLRRLPFLRLDPTQQPARNEALIINGYNRLPVIWDLPVPA